jgi:3,4-dihydroxy 2-butanone 4-phosphate synthase
MGVPGMERFGLGTMRAFTSIMLSFSPPPGYPPLPDSSRSPGLARVAAALAALRAGNGVLVTDDEERENEGDLIFNARALTVAQMAVLIRECSGIVCLCLTPERAAILELPPMVARNSSRHGTAFTVSIEAATGVTTGVSARDRVATVRAAVRPGARSADLHRPGHVFPLCARPGGVLERQGHTEATVDLMRLAGLDPAGVLCELTNPDGTMADLSQVRAFGAERGYPWLTVADLIEWRLASEDRERDGRARAERACCVPPILAPGCCDRGTVAAAGS